MISNIIKSAGPELISTLTNQFSLNQDQASKAVDVTQESLTESATKEASSGNLDGLLNMINQGSKASGSPMFQTFASNLASSYISKLGIPKATANQVTNFILPLILEKISGQSEGDLGKSDLMKLISGSTGNIAKEKATNILGNLFK